MTTVAQYPQRRMTEVDVDLWGVEGFRLRQVCDLTSVVDWRRAEMNVRGHGPSLEIYSPSNGALDLPSMPWFLTAWRDIWLFSWFFSGSSLNQAHCSVCIRDALVAGVVSGVESPDWPNAIKHLSPCGRTRTPASEVDQSSRESWKTEIFLMARLHFRQKQAFFEQQHRYPSLKARRISESDGSAIL